MLAATATSYLIAPSVTRYIETQRDRLLHRSTPLPALHLRRLGPYFDIADLELARVVVADPLPVSPPPFAGLIRRFGWQFPDISMVAGITFDYVIAVRETPGTSLLVHEMVHVAQMRLLGVAAFSHAYVRGFLSTGSYDAIPLEQTAYQLEARFRMGGEPFNITAAVSSAIRDGLF